MTGGASGIPIYIIVEALLTILKPLVIGAKGEIVTVRDPAEAMDQLANAPRSWRVILGVDDETSLEEPYSQGGFSRSHIFALVQASPGLAMDPGQQIFVSRTGGSPSVLEIAEGVRNWIRGQTLVHPSIACPLTFSWRKAGWQSAARDGSPVQFARQLLFTVDHAISPPAQMTPQTLTWP